VEIIASQLQRTNISSYRSDVESAIIETIARRPCTIDDLHWLLGIHINEINKYLGTLETEGKIITKSLERGVFYELKHK
jgi:predicted Rossmann fold nucleotide-binding protein DprA/Smf involved in DNA uptake